MTSRSFQSPNRRHDRQVFYKYTTARVAKIVLSTRKLRWSSPLLFNDPFDVTQELRLSFTEEQINLALVNRVASMIERGDTTNVTHPMGAVVLQIARNQPPEVRAAIAKELRDTIRTPTPGQFESMRMIKETWKNMVPKFRVLCFSEVNDVTPMWAHYADQHKGVVLEFTAVDEVDSPLLVARPVIYQDALPRIADIDAWLDCMLGKPGSDYWDDLFSELEYIKTPSWSYEKEWRVASFAPPGESDLFADYGFFDKELTGVYFGPKCEKSDRDDLLALLKLGLEHVQVYEAIPNVADARFTFRPIRSVAR
jgi:hypothetical protein